MNAMRTAGAVTAIVLAAALTLTAACGPPEGASADAGKTYGVRGEIVALPDDPANPSGQLRIRHEAIPEFVSYEGEVVGMSAMTMPFPTAERVDLGDLEVGDRVEFTFRVDWEGSPPYQVTEIELLPPGAELSLR